MAEPARGSLATNPFRSALNRWPGETPAFRMAGEFKFESEAPGVVDGAEKLRLEDIQGALANGQAKNSAKLESLAVYLD